MKPIVYRNPASGAAGPAGADPTDPVAIVRVVLEKSPLLIYIANLEFKIVLANRALREVTGYDTGDCPNVEALIGAFYPHGDAYAQRVRDIHDGWRRNEHIMGAKLLVQGKNGGQRTIAWYTSRLRVGRSPTIGYIAMGVDLTTQGTLEQWVGLLQRTLQHLTEGVVLTDPAGNILAWNAGASGLLGHTEEQMQGQPLSSLFVRGEREIVSRSIDQSVTGADARFAAELELLRAGGGTEVLSFTQSRLDGEGGVPLARLTVLTPSGGADPSGLIADLKVELAKSTGQRLALETEVSSLMGRVSSLDASLATHDAAAGQIADLRGQLHLAEEATTDAQTRMAALREELARTRSDHDAGITTTTEEVSAAKAAVAYARAEVEQLTDRVSALESELAAAQEQAAASADAVAAAGATQGEADAALAAARKEADAALASARKDADAAAAAAAAELASAKAATEEAASRADGVSADLAARTAELETATGRIEELEAQAAEAPAQIAALEARLKEAEAALDTAEEDFGNERGRLQDEHRKELETTSKKAAADRKALEEQLHKDILAAEERSEVELQKLGEQQVKDIKDLEQAAEIAQAEIESAAQRTIADVQARLDQVPSLTDHIGTIAELAVVSADTSGRILAWSKGAAALDGRSAEDAVGKVIHEDVLQLHGVAWKSLFGKIMVQGGIQREVTMITASGARRLVELRASLVRNAQGAPVGLTEVIRLPDVGGGLDLHAAAALGRLVAPVREMLDVRTLAGLAAAEQAGHAARGLVRLGQTVVQGAKLGDIEGVARAEDLATSLDEAEEGLSGQALSWREIRMTLQDLEHLESSVAGGRSQWRWNELVERCLHASGGDRAVRQFGDAGMFHGSGEAVVPLLLGLLAEAPDGGSGLTVATGRADGRITSSVVGGSWSTHLRRTASWLAGEAGGTVTFTGAIAKVSLPAGSVAAASSDTPALLGFDVSQVSEVSGIGVAGSDAPIVAIEAEEMDDGEEIDLEFDEGPTGPVDDRSTLQMAGLSAADVASRQDDDDDLPSDHPVLASGSVDMMEAGPDDDLMLMAGEDSIIKSSDAVYMAIRSLDDADPVLGNATPQVARAGEEAEIRSEEGPITQSELQPLDALPEVADDPPASAQKTRKRKRKRAPRKKK